MVNPVNDEAIRSNFPQRMTDRKRKIAIVRNLDRTCRAVRPLSSRVFRDENGQTSLVG